MWSRAWAEKARHDDVNQMKAGVSRLYLALWCLETGRDWDIIQNQMGHPELTIRVNEHLDLQYLVQARLIDKIEVGNNGALICATIGKQGKHC